MIELFYRPTSSVQEKLLRKHGFAPAGSTETEALRAQTEAYRKQLAEAKENWQALYTVMNAYIALQRQMIELEEAYAEMSAFAGNRRKQKQAEIIACREKLTEWEPRLHAALTKVELTAPSADSSPEEQPSAEPSVSEADAEPTPAASYRHAEAGEYITFGSYWQGEKRSEGKTPIEWLVLAKEDSRTLVISRYALDCQQYNDVRTDVTWGSCTLRRWLNETFYKEAFSTQEQSMIAKTSVKALKNPKYATNPGTDTTDKVFLLSLSTVQQYFLSNKARMCVPTAYAKAQGAFTGTFYKVEGRSTWWWWLRSPGQNSDWAVRVNAGSLTDPDGVIVNDDQHSVRPALWINL